MDMYKHFFPRIRSRHPSHDVLRKRENLPLFPFKSVVRFGSFKEYDDTLDKGGNRVEVNKVESIKNSANKLLMKECFTKDNVKTANWFRLGMLAPDGFNNPQLSVFGGKINDFVDIENMSLEDENIKFPIISKHIFGSRGKGNKKHNDLESLLSWCEGKDLDNYIFEQFYNYTREYRLHVTEEGCFYTCRKMLKNDTPNNQRWYRNDYNSVWILEGNKLFDKPSNWDQIVKESIKALKSVGLDFGAVDVKVQSSTNHKDEVRENPKFIIIEINSAPSFGAITSEKYMEIIPRLLLKNKNKWQ